VIELAKIYKPKDSAIQKPGSQVASGGEFKNRLVKPAEYRGNAMYHNPRRRVRENDIVDASSCALLL